MRYEIDKDGNEVWIEKHDVGMSMTFKQIEKLYKSMKRRRGN